MTMMATPTRGLREHWLSQAAAGGCRIVLADGDDPRAREAAHELADGGVVPLLLTADRHGLPGNAETVDPRGKHELGHEAVVERVINEQARKRGVSSAEFAHLRQDPLTLAVALVEAGLADACVAGATAPSADVARAALRVVGLASGCRTLSSSFLMKLPDGRVMSYGDCAVIPEPTAEQLADIATSTAETFEALTRQQAVVGLLSFSTHGSASHHSLEVITSALQLIRQRVPHLAVDGELQFDAAVVPSVARAKAPSSEVAGHANVLVFPNLAAGNIAYKITERLAGAQAIGPLFQGLAKPVNDLSRGCSSTDIATVSLVSAVQALAQRRQTSGRGA